MTFFFGRTRGVARAALAVAAAGLVLAAPVSAGAQGAVDLKVGDPAPAFSLPGSDGRTHTLAEYAGKKAVVLAWFPKAFTGG